MADTKSRGSSNSGRLWEGEYSMLFFSTRPSPNKNIAGSSRICYRLTQKGFAVIRPTLCAVFFIRKPVCGGPEQIRASFVNLLLIPCASLSVTIYGTVTYICGVSVEV